MKIQDLYRLKNIRETKEVILYRIEVLERYNPGADREQKASLCETVGKLTAQEVEEEKRLLALIESVDDPELRQIMTLRFLDDLPWIEVAVAVAPLEKDVSRNYPLMKIKRFLRNFPGNA